VNGAAISLHGVSHAFGATPVLHDIGLEIAPGSLVALLGPSGCGKSTLLRILAGLQRQDSGTVRVDGHAVDGLPPLGRGIGIVFQSYALFPHMTVQDNVTYGLEAQGMRRRAARVRAQEMMAMMRIAEFAGRMPRTLSGGQQQRVALARTLAVGPRILLLDEPLAALDKNLRLDMQIEIRRLQRELAITTVMVTHDQEEAMSMADAVAVMEAGRLEHFGTPAEIYDRPRTRFVAGFVGTANLLPARLLHEGETYALSLPGGRLVLDGAPGPAQMPGSVTACIRPEHWRIDPAGTLPARVTLSMPLGPTILVDLALADGTAVKLTMPRVADSAELGVSEPGQLVALSLCRGARARVFQ
jgi:putative spermidine/putrescine transport system ATP-binding protein